MAGLSDGRHSDLHWVLQHKRRWPVFVAACLGPAFALLILAQSNGRRQALADLAVAERYLAEFDAGWRQPGDGGATVADLLAEAAALVPSLARDEPSYGTNKPEGVAVDWALAWRDGAPELDGEGLAALDRSCQGVWDALAEVTPDLPHGWEVDWETQVVRGSESHQALSQVVRVRLWHAAEQGDWATVRQVSEHWLAAWDRYREIPFAIMTVIANAREFLLIAALGEASHLARPDQQTLTWLAELCADRASRPSRLLEQGSIEARSGSFIFARHGALLDQSVWGCRVPLMQVPAALAIYPIVYSVDIRQWQSWSTASLPLLREGDRRLLDIRAVDLEAMPTWPHTLVRRPMDWRFMLSHRAHFGVQRQVRSEGDLRISWLTLRLAVHLLCDEAIDWRTGPMLEESGLPKDWLADPRGPEGAWLRLRRVEDGWMVIGRSFRDRVRLPETIPDRGMRRGYLPTGGPGVWLFPAHRRWATAEDDGHD